MHKISHLVQSWFKCVLQVVAALLLAAPGWAVAQQAEEQAGEDAAAAGDRIEEVVVTGTQTGTGIRGVAPVGSQVLDIPRFELLQSPVRDAAEIITTLPQGSQIGSGVASADGGNDSGSSGLNLRGLGSNASLQLLDGHRMASQGVSEIGPDPSAIPFAAIERVEVVLDGASSVYGSDAVAGVVNYIMRDEFEGLDVQLSGQSGVYDSSKIELVGGMSRGKFNVIVGASYEDQGEMRTNERAYLMEDLRAFGGNDNRLNTPTSGNNPILSRGNNDYFVPTDFVGQIVADPNDPSRTFRIPLASELILITPANADDYVADRGDYTYFNAALERQSLFLRANYEPAENVQLTYTGLWSKREAENVSWNRVQVRAETQGPYFVPGLPAGSQFVHVSMPENGVPYTAEPYVSTINHYVDLRIDIGEWQMNSSVFYGRTHGADINRPEANNAALTNDPAGTPAGYLNYNWWVNDPEWFNPYLTDVNQPGFENLVGWTWRFADQHLQGINTRFEGPVFELPGGTARLNVGVEFSDADHWLGLPQTVRYYDKRLYWLRDTDITRRISSQFGELYAPLTEGLSLSLSARRDDYSDFGTTTNPRLGLTWVLNDSLSLRASAGEAFRAPSLTQMNPGVNSVLSQTNYTNNGGIPIPVTNPATNQSHVFTRSGRTPSLGPETARMWSLGFDWTPQQLDGLAVQLTYYDVEYEDRIEALPNATTALSSPENYAIYEPYIYPINQPATCVAGDLTTYDPELTRWLDLEGTRFAGDSNDCDTVAVIDTGEQNVGSVFQNGVDFQLYYDWDTSIGSWRASVNVAEILDLERSLISGGDTFDILDRIGWQVSRRSNLRLNWANADWSAAFTTRIEGSYLNDQRPTVGGTPLGDQNVGSWTTYDLVVGYTAPANRGFWSGVRVTLSAQNLTDEDPPIVLNGTAAFDSDVHNPFGRMWRMELGKRFE
ncbi:MAG: TonB-dependent receptor [Gammaproteobacteria bacterium]|nr:TonB-dependent receptor [Gammaproteobacteria bacterium]MDH5302894.1 TonB-dependent receptor [Gammaproteobacteria bacterium]MDH5320999.1 TonB-dependent receptor [Gammaproteobacteria bacterium]